MFTNQANVIRSNTFARAVCASELYDIYYYSGNDSFEYIIVSSSIIIPLIFIIIFSTLSKSMCGGIEPLFEPKNHANLVALLMIGTVVSVGIFVMDVIACYLVYSSNHEYALEIGSRYSINLSIVYGTLVCDILFIINLPISLFFFFYTDYKGHNFLKIDSNYFFLSMLVTPILCISSHLGYVMLAWLTEPSKSTTTLILFYFLFVSLFLIFRRFYRQIKNITPQRFCEKIKNITSQIREQILCKNNTNEHTHSNKTNEGNEQLQLETNEGNEQLHHSNKTNEGNDTPLNIVTFCLLFLYGIVILGIAIMIFSMFASLPLASEGLVNYLFNIFQIVVILISTQFAYKLLFGKKFSLKRILESFLEEIEKKSNEKLRKIIKENEDNVAKATGKIVAEYLLDT